MSRHCFLFVLSVIALCCLLVPGVSRSEVLTPEVAREKIYRLLVELKKRKSKIKQLTSALESQKKKNKALAQKYRKKLEAEKRARLSQITALRVSCAKEKSAIKKPNPPIALYVTIGLLGAGIVASGIIGHQIGKLQKTATGR